MDEEDSGRQINQLLSALTTWLREKPSFILPFPLQLQPVKRAERLLNSISQSSPYYQIVEGFLARLRRGGGFEMTETQRSACEIEFRSRSARFTGCSWSGNGRMKLGFSLSQVVRADWLMQNSCSAASRVVTLGLPRPVKSAVRRESGEALVPPPESRSIAPISR